jgi:hypothetical protein
VLGVSEPCPKAHGFDTFFGLKSGYIDYYAHTGEGGKPDLWRFIEQHADRPFFLEVAYNAPHWPYQVPDQPSTARDGGRHLLPQDSPTSTRADYVAMVERVDRGVGNSARCEAATGKSCSMAPPSSSSTFAPTSANGTTCQAGDKISPTGWSHWSRRGRRT